MIRNEGTTTVQVSKQWLTDLEGTCRMLLALNADRDAASAAEFIDWHTAWDQAWLDLAELMGEP